MIPALVLAAGLGTRLDPITRLVAKPAVPLGPQTLIERILGHLRDEGVADVVVNLHHRAETITAIVGDGTHLGLHVRYSWEREILGSAGGPRRALGLLDADEFLIVNADTLCAFPLAPMIAAHEASGADVTLAVVPNPAPNHYNGIRADEHGVVRGFEPKGRADGTWHYVGVQIAAASVFASLPDGVPAETISGLYRAMVGATPGRVCVYPVTAEFLDVGTPRDYLDAARRFGATVDEGAVFDSMIWPGLQAPAGSHFTRCVMAARPLFPIQVEDAVIMPEAYATPEDDVVRRAGVAIFPFPQLP